MTLAALAPTARQRIFSAAGLISSGAKLNTYIAGSTTPLITYSDSALTVPNSNPVLADASGLFGPIYLLPQAYKFVVTDSLDLPLWEQDSVYDVGELQAWTETKFCTSQTNATSDTALTNITGLTGFTLGVAGIYAFEVNLSGTSTVNGGLKVAFKYTSATLTNLEASSQGFTASAVATQHVTSTTDQASLFAQTAAVIAVRIVGRITVTTAGTLAVQMAQNASHSDTSSIFTGSLARFTKVS